VLDIQAFHTGFPYTSTGHSGDSHGHPWVTVGKVMISMGHRRESHGCLEKCARIGCTIGQTFPG
jgi:hypothetical protein